MGQQQHHRQLHRARLVASVAATVISLACGTNVSDHLSPSSPVLAAARPAAAGTRPDSHPSADPRLLQYVYSAWAPQFAERLKLSSTQSNLVGLFGNLGMYSLGVPVGIVIDHRGPRPFVLVGAVLLVAGYFPLHRAYDSASGSVAALCFFSFLSGLGSCMAFAAAVKTSALNWPHHRGTATAFPLAAFGLSAFLFSSLGAILFPGDPSAFLGLLSWGTFGLTLAGFFFLRVYPHCSYHAVARSHDDSFSSSSSRRPSSCSARPERPRPRRASSDEAKMRPSSRHAAGGPHRAPEPGTSPGAAVESTPQTPPELERGGPSPAAAAMDETSSLMSSCSSAAVENVVASSIDMDRSHRIDIRGLRLLRTQSFWLLFSIMAILAGIGLMTIKYAVRPAPCLCPPSNVPANQRHPSNIGNDANALWKHFDDSVGQDFLVHRQQMHVSILSVCSFVGRLLSGVGSDFLVKSLHASRLWCLFVACLVFLTAQACALNIRNPHLLGFVSGLSGLGYGFLFGVFPSIVTEAFGIRGLSQNWGFMTLAPVASSNVFNLLYGTIYDKHSAIGPGGERSCHEGLDCYRAAYWVTLGACCAGLIITLWTIRHERAELAKESRNED
ncbi:Putative membrane protein [Tolypocladium paradoxum]|uniref:Membrane protein n=1 Tax=Tolypocladium paradoxum TaxID=94208 RepID=A0A2S4L2I1_9HYPO|nr:Putative membrane protein [Tolypocladium paradoxum]